MQHKKYLELSKKEINNFVDLLDKEKKNFRLSLNGILKSEIIIKEEVGDKIAGIAGIRKYKMLPVLFIVVKSEFQGRGTGKRLMKRLHEITKEMYYFIFLSVVKDNKRAINLFKKFGYRIFREKEEFYYMFYSSLTTLEVIFKILSLPYKLRKGSL